MTRPGIYQHYKGELYLVLGVLRDSTNPTVGTEPALMVHYIPLTGHDSEPTLREERQFHGLVERTDHSLVRRFIRVELKPHADSKATFSKRPTIWETRRLDPIVGGEEEAPALNAPSTSSAQDSKK